MPMRAPRICGCGYRIASGERCPCERKRKAEADKRRPNARQRGYTTEWDKARAEFRREHPTCVRCGSPSTEVDHVIPHRGDKALMWDRRNWQALCRRCHASWKQSRERAR